MKTTLISIMAMPCLLVCFSTNGFGQQLTPMQDEYTPRENITGIGTKTVVYHVLPDYQVKNAQDIETYLERMNGVDDAEITNNSITIHFDQIIRGQEINALFERVEMYYIQSPVSTKSK